MELSYGALACTPMHAASSALLSKGQSPSLIPSFGQQAGADSNNEHPDFVHPFIQMDGLFPTYRSSGCKRMHLRLAVYQSQGKGTKPFCDDLNHCTCNEVAMELKQTEDSIMYARNAINATKEQ